MHLCFVGMNVDESMISSFDAISIAGNKYQNGLFRGLKSLSKIDSIEKFVVLPYRSFPRHRILLCRKDLYTKQEDYPVHVIKYINVPFLNKWMIKRSLFYQVKKWCLEHSHDEAIILLYNCASYKAVPLLKLSKRFNIPFFVVIADVVSETYLSNNQREKNKQEKLFSQVSGIIPITDLIWKDFAPDQKALTIEGGIVDIPPNADFAEALPIQITYTGSLDDNSNIDTLLAAFRMINNPDIKLNIAGAGKYSEMVESAAATDARIRYFGLIKNEESVRLQNQSHILVCPRLPNGYVTRYTFPSKLFEYLLTGHIVVTFHLEGIPKEYDKYLYYPETNDAEALKKKLVEIIDRGRFFRKEQVDFMGQKTWTVQAKKVADFITEATRG